MNLHLSLELVRTGAFSFPQPRHHGALDLGAYSHDSMESLAMAINSVRQHSLAQLLACLPTSSLFEKDDYREAAQKSFRTLLTDIELEGERLSFDFIWSKTGVVVITLRREEPSKVDTPTPSA